MGNLDEFAGWLIAVQTDASDRNDSKPDDIAWTYARALRHELEETLPGAQVHTDRWKGFANLPAAILADHKVAMRWPKGSTFAQREMVSERIKNTIVQVRGRIYPNEPT